MRPLAGFAEGRNTNPEFSADGRSLYFIATPDGIANIYRADLRGGGVTRVTNVRSGVTGITPLTPALSAAAASDDVVFTVFEDHQYNIYTTDDPARLAGRPVVSGDRNAAVLPPLIRRSSDVASLLATPAAGLPLSPRYRVEPYRPRLSLDVVGQPTVGVGADRFGAYAAGGTSLLWSDMLGNHELGTSLQLTSRFEEFGGVVAYINREQRWHWGIVGQQLPYVTGSFAQGITNVNGEVALVEQTHRVIETNRALSGVMQYPFSRARRVEFSGGLRRISFDQELETRIFSPITGGLIDEAVEDLPRPDALNLGEASSGARL